MHTLGADKWGQERRMDAKCQRSSAAGRPRRRARLRFRENAKCDFDGNYLPNQDELGDDAVDKVGVPIEFYNIVN